MNAHYCPSCGAGFWARGNLGDLEKLPKHLLKDRQPCPGARERAVVVKPPPNNDDELSLL